MQAAHRRRMVTIVVAVAVLVVSAGLLAAGAVADDKVLLGGGAGILVNGDTYCTLTTIGHDNAGELVGFTAAHCGGPGAQVTAEDSGATVGRVATADDGLDYAVITFDPAKVTPAADFDGFAINGIGPDPGFGQPVCTHGGATGYGCGPVKIPNSQPSTVTADVPSWQPGDDGAPVTVDGKLVGMTRGGRTFPSFVVPRVVTYIGFTLFSAILNDANAKGGPGAGFTPIPP